MMVGAGFSLPLLTARQAKARRHHDGNTRMSMSVDGLAELHLPRTLRVRAAGRTLVLGKRAGESTAHVLLKAIAYARYLPQYPDLRVEVGIGNRYKPDLVALDDAGEPRIWIECGHADADKVRKLLRRYGRTHFVWLRRHNLWHGAVAIVRDALTERPHPARVEVIGTTDATLLTLAQSGDADNALPALTVATFPEPASSAPPAPRRR